MGADDALPADQVVHVSAGRAGVGVRADIAVGPAGGAVSAGDVELGGAGGAGRGVGADGAVRVDGGARGTGETCGVVIVATHAGLSCGAGVAL